MLQDEVLDVFCRWTRRWTTFNEPTQSIMIWHLDGWLIIIGQKMMQDHLKKWDELNRWGELNHWGKPDESLSKPNLNHTKPLRQAKPNLYQTSCTKGFKVLNSQVLKIKHLWAYLALKSIRELWPNFTTIYLWRKIENGSPIHKK